tara:strand:- start:452 stop:697 length:246 start_codon:yes stop_codon:yes gene_type:complete
MSYIIRINGSYDNVILATTVDVNPDCVYGQDMIYLSSDNVVKLKLDKENALIYAKLQLDEYRKAGVNAKLMDTNNNIIKEV